MNEAVQHKINTYINNIKQINKILEDIENNEPYNKKNYKHNPLHNPDNIKEIELKGNKIKIKYNNNTNTTLFDYEEKYRSFSLSSNIEEHIDLIKKQLSYERNIIRLYLNIFLNIRYKIIKNILLNDEDKNNINKLNYNLDDILLIKKQSNNNNYEYYISICPIYSFILLNKKIYIANQYQLKFENGKFNLFYNNKYNFNKLLSRPNLKDLILEFNNSNKKVTTENFKIIIENMRCISPNMKILNNETNEEYEYKLIKIDEQIYKNKI
jgi:hypothetical protein